ncbi:MAG: DUF6503 family protein [Bacteroidia bacterium]|nr:DUF6503 family protein [Bacteroidia bacterium]
MQIRFLQGLAIILLTGCLTLDKKNLNDPQHIVDRAIEVYGGEQFLQAEINFTFRDRDYISIRNQGSYQYERLFQENGNSVRDVLNNQGFYREINGSRAEIPDTMATKYTNSVNSVIYFAVLPFGLNDPAVRKEYLGQAFIQKIPYHKIRVTFDSQGGGEDFQDVFVYWFRTDNYRMDYFAYRYYTEEGGIRFRQAYNTRNVNGLLFSDYRNYKADPAQYKVEETDRLFEENKMEELSKIELENIAVK